MSVIPAAQQQIQPISKEALEAKVATMGAVERYEYVRDLINSAVNRNAIAGDVAQMAFEAMMEKKWYLGYGLTEKEVEAAFKGTMELIIKINIKR